MTDPALTLLRQRSHLAELAATSCRFDLSGDRQGRRVRLASGAPVEPVAGDGAGGTYVVCDGGAVLYVSPDGRAGLVGDSVTEALEVVVGLPDWCAYADLTPDEADDTLERSAPALAAPRAQLRAALGLPDRAPGELVALLHAALARTDSVHLLLDTDTDRACARLGHDRRPPLWEEVLAPGLADLRLMRSDPAALTEVASDTVRRATALRAAQFDREPGDLPLLRVLLRHEASDTGMSEELRLAAVLVGRHGLAADLPLLHEVRETDQHTQDGLFELPHGAVRLSRWARALDDSRFGSDPAALSPFLWTRLACRQGRTELARAALIRALDDTGPDAALLEELRGELELLGDFAQAARAQRGLLALLNTPWERGTAHHTLARLQRSADDLPSAWAALRLALAEVAKDHRSVNWRRLALGGALTEEHLRLAAAAAGSGRRHLADEVMAGAENLLGQMPDRARGALGELAGETRLLLTPGRVRGA
ncbi:hypothetical protein [Streptomyces sp. 150FB]|uniref:hypothetical protein n=1 Tax=Streptomyces sp. 150FB TaxID=1576605 RepID=UPI0007C65127|nr:hypothetical protein [Streptomyces sp. 150FB]